MPPWADGVRSKPWFPCNHIVPKAATSRKVTVVSLAVTVDGESFVDYILDYTFESDKTLEW
jgi:hypothetical protein